MEPSTTEATCASAITPACLMKSAAKITNPSAPPVRLLCPHPCRNRMEHLNVPHSHQKASVLHLKLCLCATENSCKGRCGESFRRGLRCSCDPDCQKFKQCCSDFQTYCDAAGELRLFFPGSAHGFRQNQPEGKSRLLCACGVACGNLHSVKIVNISCLGNHQRKSVEPPVLQNQ